MDTGSGTAFAVMVNSGRDPSPQHIENVAAAVEEQASVLRTAGDTSCSLHRPRLARALEGQAGDAQIVVHDANVHLWDTHADLYEQAGRALRNALGELHGLKHDLRLLIQEMEPQYNAALRHGDATGAQAILTNTLAEADGMVADRGERAKSYVQAVNFTAPLPEHPVTGAGGESGQQGQRDKQTDPPKKPTDDTSTDSSTSGRPGAGNGAPTRDKNTPIEGGAEGGTDLPATSNDPARPLGGKQTDVPGVGGQGPVPTPFPSTQMGAGGGGGSGPGGLTSGLGSAFRPSSASMGSVPGAGAATSPASAMPRVPSTPSPTAASPLANAGSSFQSGLASGMGASGGMAPAVSAQQPLQPFVSQQPSVAAPPSGVGAAGVPAAGAGSAGSGDAGFSGGHAAGGGSAAGPGAGGGSAMMPPTAAVGASQPLAPYSAPGAGAGGTATAPATGGPGQLPSSGGPGGPSAGAAGLPPVLAGNPGSSTAMSALAGSATELNPDLLVARRVLAELTRGSTDSEMFVRWAVVVLKSPHGAQVLVANDFGNGGYLPARVFLPKTVGLAVYDPSLPVDWAEQWMGCRFPSKILADHFDRLRKTVPPLRVSAMVSEECPSESPPNCGGDFEVIRYKESLSLVSDAPKLDGAHRHRLAVIDPGLAQRVEYMDRVGAGSLWTAATLTDVLFGEARKPDDIGQPLVTDDEYSVLAAVNTDTANAEVWTAYDCALEKPDRHNAIWPQGHGPRDNDDSEFARNQIRLYRHLFRMGRMIEMVQCWKARPPRLAEIAYCGIAAGFGPLVATTITRMEQHLHGDGKP
jgi:hypothetical protein